MLTLSMSRTLKGEVNLQISKGDILKSLTVT